MPVQTPASRDTPQIVAIEIIPQSIAPPTVELTVPADGQTAVSVAAAPNATFSRAMDAATITGSSFTLSRPDGAPVLASVTYDAGLRRATLTPAEALAHSTTYTARLETSIKAADGAPLASAVSWAFTTSSPPPPTVTATAPADGAVGVSPSVRPSATFSRPLDPATVNATSFALTTATGTPVSATASYDAATRTATLDPAADLATATAYRVTASTSIRSADGVPLAAAVTWGFTTAATPPAPPTITSQSPTSGAVDVPRSTSVDVTFSRSMDPATITGSSFTLTGPSGIVTASVTYDEGEKRARLTPAAPLTYSALYTARIDASVTAIDGAALVAPSSWSFTVVDAPPPPTFTFAPADGASYVPRSTTLTASFSRSMDPTTITARRSPSVGPTVPPCRPPSPMTTPRASRR